MSMTITEISDIRIKADYSQASDLIRYSTNGGASWNVSVFSVADARHDAHIAAKLVLSWLSS